jgi:hypothetical protein
VNWSGVGRARFLCGLKMVKHPLVVGINESIGWKRIKLTMTIRAGKKLGIHCQKYGETN